MWTKEGILEFFEDAKQINTGGAANEYAPTCEFEEDGDEWARIELPVWSHNHHVVCGVFDLVQRALEHEQDTEARANSTRVYLEDPGNPQESIYGCIVLRLFTHFCEGT